MLKKRQISSLAIPLIFFFVLTMNVGAENPTVGIKVGDWIKYNVTTTGTLPFDFNVSWIKVEFVSVVGTSITEQSTMHMQNGTETSQNSTFDLATTASSYSGFVIPANSKVGDTVYISGTGTIIANETTKTYAGASRTVLNGSYSQYGTNTTYYWDKGTGVTVEISSVSSGYSISAVATETNIWSGGFLGLDWWFWVIIIVVIVIVVAVAALMLRRKKPPATAPPQQAMPPPPPPPTSQHT